MYSEITNLVGLGIVSKCSLNGTVKNINVNGRSYCVVDKGNHKHPEAIELCKKLNARLPLPRNEQESDELIKIGGKTWTNVDARNPKKTANKAEWVDAEGKPLGDRPVYLRGHKFHPRNYLNFTKIISDLYKSGKLDIRWQVTQLVLMTQPAQSVLVQVLIPIRLCACKK